MNTGANESGVENRETRHRNAQTAQVKREQPEMGYGTFQAITAAIAISSIVVAVGTGVVGMTSNHDTLPDPGVEPASSGAKDPLAVKERQSPSHVVRETVEVRVHGRDHRAFMNTIVRDALDHGATRADTQTTNLRYSTVRITAPGDYAERLRPLLAAKDSNGYTSGYRQWPPAQQQLEGPPTAMSVRVKIHFLHTPTQRNVMTASVSAGAAAVLVMFLAAIGEDAMRTPAQKRAAGG